MAAMEDELIRTPGEAKPDIEPKDAKTELSMVSINMEQSSAHNLDGGKLIGSEGDTELMPYEGMEFDSEDAAREFYNTYARSAGFRIRISRYTRSRRDNSIISRRIVCSKEGFRETHAYEGLYGDQKQQERAVTRVGCKAMIMIKKFGPGKWIVTKFVKDHNHGPVPPRKLEVMPAHRDYDLIEKPHSIEVASIEEPFEGMEFESEEAAKLFYINYARLNGFRARISRYCRSRRDNAIISRQIVCSKEGFREVRVKKEMTDEGKAKRPRMITRVGCKAMIVVKKINSGKWVVSKFEKEHNHILLTSKRVPCASNVTSGEVVNLAGKSTAPNVLKVEGCSAGPQCNSPESLTLLYNHLCQEAIKFAQEGSVTEEIYHVAMSALKEAAEKVSAIKRSRMAVPQCGFSIGESKHAFVVPQGGYFGTVPQMKAMSCLECSDEVKQTMTPQQLKLLQEPASNLVLIPSNLLTDSSIYNCSSNASLSLKFPTTGGQGGHGSEGSCLPAEIEKEKPSQKSQKTGASQTTQGSDKSSPGPSEANMVAIPAIPLTLYMPVVGNLPAASSDGPYRMVAAPIEAVPISYRPAEPILELQRTVLDLGRSPWSPSELNKREKGPNPLLHATAVACGGHVVPLEEAASLIKAIEAKIRSGGATIAKLPSTNLKPLAPDVVCMSSSSSEEDEENDQREHIPLGAEGNGHDQSSEETALHGEPSELETEVVQSANENRDGGGSIELKTEVATENQAMLEDRDVIL